MIEPRPHLRDLYRDVERGGKRVEYVRLDRNEQVSPLPESLRREFFASLHSDVLNAYPDPSPLYERLSARLNVPQESLFVTSGSDTVIRRIFEAFVRPGDAVLQPDPSYAMYQVYTKMFEARALTVSYTAARELPVSQLLAGLDERPRVMLIANPDQPTGTALTRDVLRRLAAAARERDVLMVIDEAYYPFFPETALDWRADFDNVIVSRTFSKVGGLAGVRIGYLVGPPSLVEWVQRTRGSYEVNGVAIAAACWQLDHRELERAHVEDVEAGRARLLASARNLGLDCPACVTNFQLLRFPSGCDLRAVVDGLKAEGFLIKGPFGSPALRDCLRVSLGGPDVLVPFVSALERVLARVGTAVR